MPGGSREEGATAVCCVSELSRSDANLGAVSDHRHHPDLVPRAVRQAVVEAVGGWGLYTVAQIADLYGNEGLEPAENFVATSGGQRKAAAESYHAAIDFADPAQVARYLRVVEKILDDHEASGDDDSRRRHDQLSRALKRADIERDGRGHLRLPAHRALGAPSLASIPDESGIRFQLARLERLDQEPEEMIGAAKELVEATAKHVLAELGEAVPANADLPALSKLALGKLKLHPQGIAPTTKDVEVIVRMLGSLGQTAGGLAELRNLGYGTGHGAERRVRGLKGRHAVFAARAAITYVSFVLDTLHDADAPWRPKPVPRPRPRPGQVE
jgi:hypothetical protein